MAPPLWHAAISPRGTVAVRDAKSQPSIFLNGKRSFCTLQMVRSAAVHSAFGLPVQQVLAARPSSIMTAVIETSAVIEMTTLPFPAATTGGAATAWTYPRAV